MIPWKHITKEPALGRGMNRYLSSELKAFGDVVLGTGGIF